MAAVVSFTMSLTVLLQLDVLVLYVWTKTNLGLS